MANDAGKQQPPSLDEFSKRLNAARGAETNAEGSPEGTGASMGRAFRVASELLASLFVGALLGVGLDRLVGTSPLFLLVGIGLGFVAGLINTNRAMKQWNKPASDDG